jgi:hypothetical protein
MSNASRQRFAGAPRSTHHTSTAPSSVIAISSRTSTLDRPGARSTVTIGGSSSRSLPSSSVSARPSPIGTSAPGASARELDEYSLKRTGRLVTSAKSRSSSTRLPSSRPLGARHTAIGAPAPSTPR